MKLLFDKKRPALMNELQRTAHFQLGLSLIELMIAMTIGIIMTGGAFYVYTNARAAFLTNENYSRMQENARYALALMEPDVQHAGFWGNHNDFSQIRGNALERAPGDVIVVGNDCAPNWVLRFDQYIQGVNNAAAPPWACISNNRFLPGTDVMVARRASTTPVAALNAGQIYIRSSEIPDGAVFVGANPPPGLPVTAENFDLIAHAYYVSSYTAGNSNTVNDGIPSLRRVELTGGPALIDNEVVPGVDNMQILYGIAPVGSTGVSAYVSADNPLLNIPNTTIRAVRIYLLMRAERQETGYVDDVTYQMGDFVTAPQNDAFRRMVVSRTIFLRNR